MVVQVLFSGADVLHIIMLTETMYKVLKANISPDVIIHALLNVLKSRWSATDGILGLGVAMVAILVEAPAPMRATCLLDCILGICPLGMDIAQTVVGSCWLTNELAMPHPPASAAESSR